MQRSEFIVSVGERIRSLRKRKGLTLLQLASLCGTSEKHLGQLERGRDNATLELLEKIASNLSVDMRELLVVESKQNRETILSELKRILARATDDELQRIYRVVKACEE